MTEKIIITEKINFEDQIFVGKKIKIIKKN